MPVNDVPDNDVPDNDVPDNDVPGPDPAATIRTLEVDRGDYHHIRVDGSPLPEPRPGEAVLRIDRFALTANNITYAVVGDMLDYWGFFPTVAPWGRVPAMGLATVSASASDQLSEGGTYFGFYPMASHLVVEPTISSAGFVDRAAHRSRHAAAYRTYTAVGDDMAEDPDTADRHLLLQGLFLTSFLLDDHLDEADFHGADTVVVTSASSKTALAFAHCLSRRPQVSAVGLTSETNRAFVEATGLYDSVHTYDVLDALDTSEPSMVVDMAGSAALLAELHRRLGAMARFSSRVGGTHWEDPPGDGDLVGPTPEFFFAPTQISKRHADWGPAVFESRSASALGLFIEDSRRWLDVEHHHGPVALGAAYRSVLEGRQPPHAGVVASMWPTGT